MLGGALRGFNLLLVLAGLMVGALLTQWRWTRRSLEAIQISPAIPADIFANRAFTLRYRLTNASNWMPGWMLRVEQSIKLEQKGDQGRVATGVAVLRPNSSRWINCEATLTRRGRYQLGPTRLMTCFPFSLLEANREHGKGQELVVYPELFPLRRTWRQQLESRGGGTSATQRRNGPTEGDFFGLREWQNGDSPKWIHWRTSARLNELAVRQFEHQRRLSTCLLVDTWTGQENDENSIEEAISLAASLLTGLLSAPNDQLILAIAHTKSDTTGSIGIDRGRKRMLEMLSDADACQKPDWGTAIRQVQGQTGSPKELLVISSRSLSDFQARQPESARMMRQWMRRGSIRWVDVTTDLGQWVAEERRSSNKKHEETDFPTRRTYPARPILASKLDQSDRTNSTTLGVARESETQRTPIAINGGQEEIEHG